MVTSKRPFGFGDEKQTAEFFGIPRKTVRENALSGDWPSYVISGKRVFNIDALVDLVVAGHGEEVGQR